MQESRKVAERLLALIAVSSTPHEQPPHGIRSWLEEHNLKHVLSPWESAFLFAAEPSHEQLVAASWRLEGCPVLLWALGALNELGPASVDADWNALGITPEFMSNPKDFLEGACLRSESEILDLQSEIEALHWGIRAGPTGRKLFPSSSHDQDANPSIVYERHYAINWVSGLYEEWDSVQTDT